MKCNTKRPPRQAVLIVSHCDGHLEAFAERNIDVHIARVPQSFSSVGERQAEEVAEAMLPRRYRELWRADRLRKTGTVRPLQPSVLADSLAVRGVLSALNSATTAPAEQEVCAWTL